jgi:flagellar motility protein MotE (MotC chaperone)
VTGERLRFQDVLRERNALKDSVEDLRLEIARQETTLASYRKQIATTRKALVKLSGKKSRLETKVAYLQSKSDSLHRALTHEQIERIQRLAKMLKTMNTKKVTQYLLSLDNKTILTLLQISPEKQAATILSSLEPSRAAALTRKYVSLN